MSGGIVTVGRLHASYNLSDKVPGTETLVLEALMGIISGANSLIVLDYIFIYFTYDESDVVSSESSSVE